MSSNDSRATSANQTADDDIPKASTSKSASEPRVDTPETDPKEGEQDEAQGSHKSDDDDDEEDEDEEQEEQGTESKETDEANTDSKEPNTLANTAAAGVTAGDWQALWSPQHNAYYFYNARTQETTWTNPLQPQAESNANSGAGSSSSSSLYPPSAAALYAAAEAAGIDPSLAHLDPTLVMPGGTSSGVFTAKFNARTGAFTRMDGRDPSFLSEAERAKRMSDVYFDVNAWETELDHRYEEEAVNGKKRKRPTKKDLEKFKEQKRAKKIAKTAWLRT